MLSTEFGNLLIKENKGKRGCKYSDRSTCYFLVAEKPMVPSIRVGVKKTAIWMDETDDLDLSLLV